MTRVLIRTMPVFLATRGASRPRCYLAGQKRQSPASEQLSARTRKASSRPPIVGGARP